MLNTFGHAVRNGFRGATNEPASIRGEQACAVGDESMFALAQIGIWPSGAVLDNTLHYVRRIDQAYTPTLMNPNACRGSISFGGHRKVS